jgi:hypothetical protein
LVSVVRRYSNFLASLVLPFSRAPAREVCIMAKLTSARRSSLPRGSFAIPSRRAYPIHDRSHAANALARVSQHGTPSQRAQVRGAVCRRYPTMPTCKR